MSFVFGFQKRKPFYIIFWIIIFVITMFLVFKPVMKIFYPVKYIDIIKKYSSAYSLDEHMVMAVISTESKFDQNAISRKNAKGLMQLKEKTAIWCMEEFGIKDDTKDFFNPELNIRIGCAYLSYLIKKFDGNMDAALSSYNAGEGNVSNWLSSQGGKLKNIPFEETRNYVKTVNNKTKIYHYLY